MVNYVSSQENMRQAINNVRREYYSLQAIAANGSLFPLALSHSFFFNEAVSFMAGVSR